MHILVAGSTGFLGSALIPVLRSRGHTITRLVRPDTTGGDGPTIAWDPAAGVLPGDALDGVDLVLNLAGRSIGERRWSDAEKRLILESRTGPTDLLARAIAAAPHRPALVNASAIGFYGHRGDEVVAEDDPPGEGFFPEVCVAWEAATRPASDAGARVALLRTGIVLSADGGAIGRLLAPFGPRWLSPYRWGLGGVVGRGRQWWSWISLDDAIRAMVHVIESDIRGPVNLVTGAVTHRGFIKALGRALRRPTILPIPPFVVKALLGSGLARATVLEGQRVVPLRLEESGFAPTDPDLLSALQKAFGRV